MASMNDVAGKCKKVEGSNRGVDEGERIVGSNYFIDDTTNRELGSVKNCMRKQSVDGVELMTEMEGFEEGACNKEATNGLNILIFHTVLEGPTNCGIQKQKRRMYESYNTKWAIGGRYK
ncbi:hypothetical protein PIB30_071552 [Stylosanthes scabra]|uniref:Uncharacterized protein n=1 Tax=Stylosanthes scabra TaxID=79078 RepID=A0ABU6ZMG6_9FABA|nr:hypothetical protein [Stylosanthes scabra]